MDSESTFEYTRPRLNKEEMLGEALYRVGYERGIGFINTKLSSENIIEQLPKLKPEYRTCSFTNLENESGNNNGAEILFLTGLHVITQEEYNHAIDYQIQNKVKRIIFLSDEYPDIDPFYNPSSCVLEDNDDGFFLEIHSKKNKIWAPIERDHYYQDPKKLSDLFFTARQTARGFSVSDESRFWPEYKNISYDVEFQNVLPEGITGYCEARKDNKKQTSVIDLFADPAMVRYLKRGKLVNIATAVGLSDSRTGKEKMTDAVLGVSYITERQSAGLWTGKTWGKIKEFINNKPQLKKNGGIDLVIARPVGGWRIGEKPPFSAPGPDHLYPPFEMQYVILSRMWEIVAKNGTLLIQMPQNSHNETRLYVQQLKEAGFDVLSDINDSPNNFTSVLKITKKDDSPTKLPRPLKFKTQGGIQ